LELTGEANAVAGERLTNQNHAVNTAIVKVADLNTLDDQFEMGELPTPGFKGSIPGSAP
jgi:hypothetical protein